MCNAYDIGAKIRPGHNTRSEKILRERIASLPKTRTIRKTDPGLVVRLNDDGEREPEIMRWGFDRKINPCINNTRADKIVAGRSMWSKAWSERWRCLIAVEAFYEWSGPKGHKQAHRIRATDLDPDHWMWMAGVWEEHAEHGLCYSMITTTPNAAMEHIHNRMPVILPFAKTDEFLNGDDPVDLLAPYNGELETPECESPLKSKPLK
jgi:putative SOS response-associated peptidase YedK